MQKERLLIVDDDEAFRESTTRIAALADYEVMTTSDPVVARALMGAWRPFVVIIDLLLAAAQGARLLRQLGAEMSPTHVIVSSGLGDSAPACALDIATQHGLKTAGFLSKPLQPQSCRDLLIQIKSTKKLTLAELGEAIKKTQLFLEYQPQLDCRFDRIIGVEALVRWQHPTRGLIAPSEFIPLAEETDLVDELTDWVFSTATNQLARWRDEGFHLQLAVNISAHNLESVELSRRLTQQCNTVGLNPRSVTLEIAESSLMRDAAALREALNALRFEGFGVSIDEFGTGYSPLVELHRMPLTEIKIDRSLVPKITNDRDCQVMVAIMINIARKLELEIVAVGVESEQVLGFLTAFGCGTAQGYHISPPVDPELIPQIVAEWNLRSTRAVA